MTQCGRQPQKRPPMTLRPVIHTLVKSPHFECGLDPLWPNRVWQKWWDSKIRLQRHYGFHLGLPLSITSSFTLHETSCHILSCHMETPFREELMANSHVREQGGKSFPRRALRWLQACSNLMRDSNPEAVS